MIGEACSRYVIVMTDDKPADAPPPKKTVDVTLPAPPKAPAPSKALVVRAAYRKSVSAEHPWGGVELVMTDGSTLFLGNDVIRDAPWR